VASEGVIARSLDESARLWRPRDAAGELIARYHRGVAYDVSLPIATMPEFLAQLERDVPGVLSGRKLEVFGHLGDGNLHLIGELGDNDLEALDRIVYGALPSLGSVSAEHGIGRWKRTWLGRSRSKAEIEVMRQLKATLDPRGILNPGRVL
jgi:FAD/FMN-containing dehydrogenase